MSRSFPFCQLKGELAARDRENQREFLLQKTFLKVALGPTSGLLPSTEDQQLVLSSRRPAPFPVSHGGDARGSFADQHHEEAEKPLHICCRPQSPPRAVLVSAAPGRRLKQDLHFCTGAAREPPVPRRV